MHKTGAIILGVGGDNVDERRRRLGIPGTSIGTFYEGAMAAGVSSEAVDQALHADIQALGYGQSSS